MAACSPVFAGSLPALLLLTQPVAALMPGSQSDPPNPQWAVLGVGKVTLQGTPSLLPSSPFLVQDTLLLSTASQNGCILGN